MSAADQVLQRLDGFPQDLSSLTLPPSATADDLNDITASLASLSSSNNTPEARHSIVQVAALLPPSKALQDVALLWLQDPGPSVPAFDDHALRGLADGTYDAREWLRAAATTSSKRGRTLLPWGFEHFDDFLTTAKDLWDEPTLRSGIITLIQSVILASPYTPETPVASTPMYHLAAHDFLPCLLNSLLFDTSNNLFPVSISAFVTMLPFALPLMTKHVPLLMVILGRAICWRDRPFVDSGAKSVAAVTKTPPPNPDLGWHVATMANEPDETQQTSTQKRVIDLFLIALYGAWPSNILAFIRDQPSYLKQKEVEQVYAIPWEEVWEPGLLGSRLLPLITEFQLHPSMVSFTSTGELKDEKRWDKYDPSEFVAMANFMSHGDDPEAMFEFFQVPSVALDPLPQPESQESLITSGREMSDIRRLQEENELLRLEALYAERIRKQMVYHIGRLHRNSLRFTSDEAEIHTFVNRIKEQTKTISTLTAQMSQHRADASQAQQKHVKWQEQLRDKVSGFREERRNWQTEASQLRSDLSEAQATIQRMRDELALVKNERFLLQSQLLESEPKIRHIEDVETRVKQLTDSQLLWDNDIKKLRDAEASATAAKSRCHELETMLRAREKVCREQADMIQHLEDRVVSVASSVPPTPKDTPQPLETKDTSFYVNVAENARKRVEKLERENLELNVEVERLRRQSLQTAAAEQGRELLFGTDEK